MKIVIWTCWIWIEGKIHAIFCNKFHYAAGFFINCLSWAWPGNRAYHTCNKMGTGETYFVKVDWNCRENTCNISLYAYLCSRILFNLIKLRWTEQNGPGHTCNERETGTVESISMYVEFRQMLMCTWESIQVLIVINNQRQFWTIEALKTQ